MSSESSDLMQYLDSRLRLTAALRAAAAGERDSTELEAATTAWSEVAVQGDDDIVTIYRGALDALSFALRWSGAVWNAESDADRHRQAARLRGSDLRDRAPDGAPAALRAVLSQLAELDDVAEVAVIAAAMTRISLPARLTELFRSREPRMGRPADPPPEPTPAAALMIRLQGEPVMRPTILQPSALHQLEVEARVTFWPDDADELHITFLTVHPREFLQVSELRFTRDGLLQPLEIRVDGTRPPNDPPLGLTARGTFVGGGRNWDARLTGNTTLELATFDRATAEPLAMPTAARRLQQMMGELGNALPHLDPADRVDARLLLEGALRFAHMALDDRLEPGPAVDEAWFQRELRTFLQADPRIGARLEERQGRAGGITDLGLGNIVLELKVEKDAAISLATASAQYVNQATQYGSAGDSQVSLLAVLDVSPKRAPAGVMGNEVGWAYPEVASGPDPLLPSLVGVLVVRAGFPRPSDFSR